VSYSLAVSDGDLVQNGSQLSLVFGVDKLRQDIQLWLTERHGGDRFHVNMGSILQDFIGLVANESSRVEVQSEVLRVLEGYQQLQLKKFKDAPQSLSASELLVSVDKIITAIKYDTVNVTIKLRNGSKQYTTIKVVSTT
jgi:phage baseplate assembly protein W